MRPAGLVCALALAAGVAAGIGCGSSGTIPSGDAQQLHQGLDGVRSAIAAGHCSAATTTVDAVRSEARSLDVPAKLRRNIDEGLAKLRTAASSDCQTARPQTETQATTTVTTTSTPTATTQTTETTKTTPTATTPTTTVPPETTTTEPPTGGVTSAGDQGGFTP